MVDDLISCWVVLLILVKKTVTIVVELKIRDFVLILVLFNLHSIPFAKIVLNFIFQIVIGTLYILFLSFLSQFGTS